MIDDNRTQPHKPGGDLEDDGGVRDVEDRQAVRNQGEVTPDDYPAGSNGKPEMPDTPPPD